LAEVKFAVWGAGEAETGVIAGEAADKGVSPGLGVAGVEIFDGFFIGIVKLDGTPTGLVGCGATGLVAPKDNLGDIKDESELLERGGFEVTGAGLVAGVMSNPPNAEDKSPNAVKFDDGAVFPEGAVGPIVRGGALGAGAGFAGGAYSFNIEFFKSFLEVGRPLSAAITGAVCVCTGESNSNPNKDEFDTRSVRARTASEGEGVRDLFGGSSKFDSRASFVSSPVTTPFVVASESDLVESEVSRSRWRVFWTIARGTSWSSSE